MLRVPLGSNEPWAAVDLEEIEDAAGGPLPPLPGHDDLYRQVLQAGGGVFNETFRRVFEAVQVEDIPVPHNPSNCEHYPRFCRIEQELRDTSPDGAAKSEEVGRRFIESLTPTDWASCRYHEGQWQAVADESVRIIKQLGRVDSELYVSEAETSNLNDEDRWRLRLLFTMPIDIGGDEFTDGQHRACALRFSGATHAALVVGDEHLGQEEEVWIYVGGG
jgi:hypothetical protein